MVIGKVDGYSLLPISDVPEILLHESQEGLSAWAKNLSIENSARFAPIVVKLACAPDEKRAANTLSTILEQQPSWVNAKDPENGSTALIEASRLGHFSVVETLIKHKANARLKNKQKKNALDASLDYLAHPNVQEVLVDMILDSRPFTAKEKDLALMRASDEPMNIGATRSLVKHGAGFSVVSWFMGSRMGTALAAVCGNVDDDEDTIEKMLAALLSSSAATAVLDDGWGNEDFGAPVHRAAYMGNCVALKKLIAAGALLNPPVSTTHPDQLLEVDTPLMSAARSMRNDAIDLLLKHGAKPNLVDSNGLTVLHHLASGDSPFTEKEERESMLACLSLLLQSGADPTAKDMFGRTPASVARDNGRHQMAKMLDQASPSPPRRAARRRPI